MNLPPSLRTGLVAHTQNLAGTVDPETLVPGALTELVFTCPLPSGFVVSPTAEWMVTLPPGFTLPAATSGSPVSFFALAPYQENAILNPPSTEGPSMGPMGPFPAGTLWVWSALNNAPTYTGFTLQFILQNVVNPTATGVTGNIAVQINGTSTSTCVFTVPGLTIAND